MKLVNLHKTKPMKKILLIVSSFMLFSSCTKDENPVATQLTINFNQTINGSNLYLGCGCLDGSECLENHTCCLGSLPYKNNEGQEYSVERLWYIISNITLHAEDGTNNLIRDVQFINIDDPTTKTLIIDDLEDNNYTSISYTIGLDTNKNISNLYLNEDFHTDMFWPELMGGGYHYMKLEGNFNDEETFYNTHTGGTMGMDFSFNNSNTIALITDATTESVEISINMEVNNWYKNPNSITLTNDGIMGNIQMQAQLKANGADVFTTTIN